MTDIRQLGTVSRAVLSLIFGSTLTFVFVALAMFGTVALGRWGIVLGLPILPGVVLSGAIGVLGNGPEQILPIIYSNIAFYSLLVFAVWQYRWRTVRQP